MSESSVRAPGALAAAAARLRELVERPEAVALLFLRQLRRINLRLASGAEVFAHAAPCAGAAGDWTLSRAGEEARYFVARHATAGGGEAAAAIPLDAVTAARAELVFARLPLCSAGLSFACSADWEVTSSRAALT
eukprot:gene2194-8397_t